MKSTGDKRPGARKEMRAASVATSLSRRPEAAAPDLRNDNRLRSIELHITELALHGFAQADRRPIAESMERELRRLLTNKDFANATSLTIERIAGGSFQLETNRRHESAGTNIARAIYRGLRQ
jgi:hypothetical protein